MHTKFAEIISAASFIVKWKDLSLHGPTTFDQKPSMQGALAIFGYRFRAQGE